MGAERASSWPVRVDGAFLCGLAREGDLTGLRALRQGARQAAPAVLRQVLLLHGESVREQAVAGPLTGFADAARELAEGLRPQGTEKLARDWRRGFRPAARRLAHRFDLYADYLGAAGEFVLAGVQAVPAALPARRLGDYLDTLAGSLRHGAVKYADRELYRLTKQMVREGVLTWRDELGHVQEHPALRQHTDDPAPLVAEREFRREVKAFVARFGPRLLGRVVWERFRLHFFDGWTQTAIAQRHGVSQQAVSESLALAATRLREAFETRRQQP